MGTLFIYMKVKKKRNFKQDCATTFVLVMPICGQLHRGKYM